MHLCVGGLIFMCWGSCIYVLGACINVLGSCICVLEVLYSCVGGHVYVLVVMY